MGSCCVAHDTLITMHDRTRKKIEDIKLGDLVLNSQYKQVRVIEIIAKFRSDVYKLFHKDGETLFITPDHPYRKKDDFKFYVIGDPSDSYIPNTSHDTESKYEMCSGERKVYNLKLDSDDHTYIQNNIIVHNGGGCGSSAPPPSPDYLGQANKQIQNSALKSSNFSSDLRKIKQNYNNRNDIVNKGLNEMGITDQDKFIDAALTNQNGSYVTGSYKDGTMELVSDEKLKDKLSPESQNALYIPMNDDMMRQIADLKNYFYSYKPEFQKKLNLDGQLHYGPMAQDLLKIPYLSDFVSEENGFLKLENLDQMALLEVKLIQFLREKLEALQSKLSPDLVGTYSDKGDMIYDEEEKE